jgi:GNAT superfamily N-acetyltransferase
MIPEQPIRKIIRKILFEDASKAVIEPIEKSDIDAVLSVCDQVFSSFKVSFDTSCSTGMSRDRFENTANWNKSAKLIKDGKIIGYAILSDYETLEKFIGFAGDYGYNLKTDSDKIKSLSGKNGIQLMSIGVLPEYRSGGYGKMLFDFPKKFGYDYMWSVQMKGISNMEKWSSKGPVIVTGKSPLGQELYITIEVL